MKMNRTTISGNGKYCTENNNGILTVYRNGKEWNRNLIGDGYVLSLIQRIEDLEDQVIALTPPMDILYKGM